MVIFSSKHIAELNIDHELEIIRMYDKNVVRFPVFTLELIRTVVFWEFKSIHFWMDTDVLEYRFGPIFRGEKFDKFFNIKVSNLNLIPQT